LASIGSKRRRSELFTVGPKLLEIGDDIVDVRILRARGSQRTRKHEGSENVNLKICHWPIRRFCI